MASLAPLVARKSPESLISRFVSRSSLRSVVAGLSLIGLVVTGAAGLVAGPSALARDTVEGRADPSAVAVVNLAVLPAEAQHTHRLIRAGGPFPYGKDGSVFGNREGFLPRRSRGFYREYTVPTPGSQDRGARRIVCGGTPATQPEACFYTDDHYASFRRIAP